MMRVLQKQSSTTHKVNRCALSLTIAIHCIVAASSFYITLREPDKPEPVLLVDFIAPELDMRRSDELKFARSAQRSKAKVTVPVSSLEQKRSREFSKNDSLTPNAVIDTTRTIPSKTSDRVAKKAQERDLSPQEALKELVALLDRHPEFRETIMREMFSGDASLPHEKPKFDLRLEELLKKEKWKSSYEYELMKKGGGGYTGPYDPVHGYGRDQKLGIQIDVFKLLDFLRRLIGGQ